MSSITNQEIAHAYYLLLESQYSHCKSELPKLYGQEFLIDVIHELERAIVGVFSYMKNDQKLDSVSERISYISQCFSRLSMHSVSSDASFQSHTYIATLSSAAYWTLQQLSSCESN